MTFVYLALGNLSFKESWVLLTASLVFAKQAAEAT